MIKVKKGSSYTKVLSIAYSSGIPVDITGYTIFFTVKRYGEHNATDDSTALISKTLTTHSSPTTGNTILSLSATDTNIAAGTYVADCKLFVTGSVNENTDTEVFIIEDVVTRRTA